ncbi:TVA4 protein, partial [Alaudala cheleensis]|nr:TVA4 protein [Alaudala cheleensis]
FLAVALARAQIQQEPSLEITEGTGINISCSHPQIADIDWINWYRQLPGQGPEFLVNALKGFKDVSDIGGRLW